MVLSSKLTDWLNKPAFITESEREQIAGLLKTYPYLVPLRQLDLALRTAQPDTDSWNHTPIYIGNRVCFWEMQQKLNAPQHTDTQHPMTAASSTFNTTAMQTEKEELLFEPAFTTDYFFHQGIKLEDDQEKEQKADQSLMVMRSFSEWLSYFRTKKEAEKQEEREKKELKEMWQREKLAAALESESDEIPEAVLKMAANSITMEESLASESFAEILFKQGKHDQAIEMYRKLSLRNPQKNTYFARKVEEILKVKQS